MNWEDFKETKIAVKCTTEKESFFSECARHGIYNFMSESAMLRNYFICRLCYRDQFSVGRYELMSVDEWQIKENGLFGKNKLQMKEVDELYMQRCLQLARCGAGSTSPNPMVGAVIVCDGRIIGEGYHIRAGEPHAEVNAVNSVLADDKPLLRRSTIYVSLEPCSHYGKTPPCCDLIISCGDLDPRCLSFLATFSSAPVIYVHGNHDDIQNIVNNKNICLDFYL